MKSPIAMIAATLLTLCAPLAAAREALPEAPAVLVATQSSVDGLEETVVLAVPQPDGSHFGFVLNKPTQTPLGTLFPDDEASRRANAKVFIGGPKLEKMVFALVRRADDAQDGLRGITPELSVAIGVEEVDTVIAHRARDARFYLGMIVWNEGELEDEVRSGAWHVKPPEMSVVMSAHPEMLWPRLAPPPDTHFARLE
jgi:putative AlgH/UPF0301 family transcriptional regulator